MRKIEKAAKFIVLSVAVLLIMAAADLLILVYAAVRTGDNLASNASAAPVASGLEKAVDENGRPVYTLSKKGKEYIDKYNGFAFLLGEDGEVIWNYNMPDELPRHYKLSDVARFTRYYLNDYPVYIRIVDEGLVVFGTEKYKTWKYQLVFQNATMDIYMNIFPVMLTLNIAALALVPFFIIRSDARRREIERTAWIAGISHDIRTPLSLALGYADEIARLAAPGIAREADNARAKETYTAIAEKAEAIKEQSLRLRTLVTNLNTSNKLSYGVSFFKTGYGGQKKERVCLAALIRETVCDILNRKLEGKYDIDVIIEKEAEQLYVKGDAELIRRALENLLSNSIRHNPRGCHILVSLSRQKKGLFKTATLTVSDNGRGVDKNQLKDFRRSVKNTSFPEHGLGIRLVRQIASFHHWKVCFSNNVDGGFCCVLTIF